jgi:leucyl/phenylalanyl-tRNA---protein transferase
MRRPSAQLVLSAYAQGVFPMAHPEEDDRVYWYAPDPRAILPLDELKVPRRLAQTVRQGKFEVRLNSAFEAVMRECASPRPDQPKTWISEGLTDVYRELHEMGYAHSVEAWKDNRLVGGLYGVALGGLFAGESMFFRETDASKVCLVHLVERMRHRGYELLDIQFMTAHLRSFGAIEISRMDYERRLSNLIDKPCEFV